jgi:hypothetical protein
MTNVFFKRLEHGEGLLVPSRGSERAAGLDLRAAVAGHIEPGDWKLVPTPSQVHDDPPAYAGEADKDGGKRHPHQHVAHPGAHRRDLSTDATASPIRSGE